MKKAMSGIFWEERKSNGHFDKCIGRTMREEIVLKDGKRHTYVPLPSKHGFPLPAIHIPIPLQSPLFINHLHLPLHMLHLHVSRDVIRFSLSFRDSPGIS